MPDTITRWCVREEVSDSEASDLSSDSLDKQLEPGQESQPSESCRICIYNTECRAWKHEMAKNENTRIQCAICQVSVHRACASFAYTKNLLRIRIYICMELAFVICPECIDKPAAQKIHDSFIAIMSPLRR
ncbi:hypothetical protein DL98DRAFT_522708 [Cadophora sp. DSE1049]|nr:hypothetical protein DL98DRAFT_522708 [Cadophora sp. DSE1049]